MRIISKFKDYYDSLQDFTSDVRYVRFRQELPTGNPVAPFLSGKESEDLTCFELKDNFIPEAQFTSSVTGINKYVRTTLYSVIVIFCGRVYHGIRAVHIFTYQKPIHKFFWSVDSFNREFNFVDKVEKGFYTRQKQIKDIHEAIFYEDSLIAMEMCHEYKSPTFVMEPMEENTNKWVAVVNPCLRDIEFFKALTVEQTFQELSMFIGGVLTTIDEPSPMPDKAKVVSHGFDVVASFRKSPTKVHR